MSDKSIALEEASQQLTEVSPSIREKLMERYRLLQPHLEQGASLSALAREHGIPLRTAQRWVQQYQAGGLRAWLPKSRSDKGKHRKLHPDLALLAEGLALSQKHLSIAAIHREIVGVAETQGWQIPSYDLIHQIISEIDPALRLLAHKGSKAYKEAFDLLYLRQSKQPNEIWQADHSELPILLVLEDGSFKKPQLTVILDDYSRAVASYYLSLEAPSAMKTALTLRQGIWRKADPRWIICGIPDVFYTDHGSDFTSQHLEQVSAALKMGLVFSEVGVPRGRGRIERFFQTIAQLLLCKLPGYCPKKSNKPVSKPKLRLEDLDELLKGFFLETYHQRVHSETQQKPQERWQAQGFLPQMPESLEELDLLLLNESRSRMVRQEGIRFHNHWYTEPVLAAYVNEEVLIRYDPRDMAEVRVFHEGRFLCRAICYELAGENISLKEIQQARRKRKRALQGEIRQRKEAVKQYLHPEESPAKPAEDDLPIAEIEPAQPKPKLKRYFNE